MAESTGSSASRMRKPLSPRGVVARTDIALDKIRQRAEATVRSLPPLNMPAERHALSVSHGVHGRRKAGPGDTFWQYRPYMTGDSAEQIDWRRSARSDLRYVRQNEWETAQNVWLWCDMSGSMFYRSGEARESKAERAMSLAVAAAMMLVAGGERVGYAGAMRSTTEGSYAVSRIVDALDLERFSEGTGMPGAENLGRRAHLIAISDFLLDTDELNSRISALSAHGVSGHLIRVIDPGEEEFPFRGRIRFIGVEGDGDEVLPRAEDTRAAYQARMSAWGATVEDIARRHGWSCTHHRSDRPAHMALLGLLGALDASRFGLTKTQASGEGVRGIDQP